jgi:hypothetical protein
MVDGHDRLGELGCGLRAEILEIASVYHAVDDVIVGIVNLAGRGDHRKACRVVRCRTQPHVAQLGLG